MWLSWLRKPAVAGLTSVAVLAVTGHNVNAQSASCYVFGGTINIGSFDLLTCAVSIGAGFPTYGQWGGYILVVDNNFNVYLNSQYVGTLPEGERALTTRCQQGDINACQQYNLNVDTILAQCNRGVRVLGICNN